MTRTRLAARLSALVALSGLAPITVVAVVGLQAMESRGERAAREGLRAVAQQAAGRIEGYVGQQWQLLGSLAANLSDLPDAPQRLREATLDAPGLRHLRLIPPGAPPAALPPQLSAAQVARAGRGERVVSEPYLAADATPAQDACLPARARPGWAVCASFDLLELQRFVQRIRVGETGYALVLAGDGRVLASGSGQLRAAVLTGERIKESGLLSASVRPENFESASGVSVLAGWAPAPSIGGQVVVELPLREAMRAGQAARRALGVLVVLALFFSVGVGVLTSRQMLVELEAEERWRTAGQIAAGITHDLGHRVAILHQTASLADSGEARFLPLIRDNLRAEADVLRRFVNDFADLSREVSDAEMMPVELAALLSSIQQAAAGYGVEHGIRVALPDGLQPAWVRGDRYLLERALLNLVRNAVEASPQGSQVELLLSTPPGKARVEVRDRGQGIEASRLPRLFDAFASTKRTGTHVGLGLPNVRRIVRVHGGEISVTSTVGQGTTFAIELPALPAQTK